MLERDLIVQTESEWGLLTMIVLKKDRGKCMVVDYHELNIQTKRDTFLLPRIKNLID